VGTGKGGERGREVLNEQDLGVQFVIFLSSDQAKYICYTMTWVRKVTTQDDFNCY